MSAVAISAVIGAVAVILSTVLSVFIAGRRYGSLEEKVNVLMARSDGTTGMIAKVDFISDRLAKIEGMFTLTLRGKDEQPEQRGGF